MYICLKILLSEKYEFIFLVIKAMFSIIIASKIIKNSNCASILADNRMNGKNYSTTSFKKCCIVDKRIICDILNIDDNYDIDFAIYNTSLDCIYDINGKEFSYKRRYNNDDDNFNGDKCDLLIYNCRGISVPEFMLEKYFCDTISMSCYNGEYKITHKHIDYRFNNIGRDKKLSEIINKLVYAKVANIEMQNYQAQKFREFQLMSNKLRETQNNISIALNALNSLERLVSIDDENFTLYCKNTTILMQTNAKKNLLTTIRKQLTADRNLAMQLSNICIATQQIKAEYMSDDDPFA
jgi:hypothetical protein